MGNREEIKQAEALQRPVAAIDAGFCGWYGHVFFVSLMCRSLRDGVLRLAGC
jgi:hypothetical protein